MNKRLLKITLLATVCLSMPASFTSCKDYDDDITEINTTTNGLDQQIQDLKSALQAAQAEAQAARAAADAAAEAAKTANSSADAANAAAAAANAAVSEAKAAAAQAKADALAEITKQAEALQKQINSNAASAQKNAEDIAALVGRINGIENGLANIDLTDINKQLGDQAALITEANTQIQALKVQIEALEAYKTQIAALGTEIEDVKTQLAAIPQIQTQLSEALAKANANATAIAENKTAIAENKAALAELKGQLETISASIATEVSNAINTIAGVIAQRLTSVTLIPDLYVGGIPTIEFESAQYQPKKLQNGVWVNDTSKPSVIVSNNETEAEYRLNPAAITEDDIVLDGLAYVTKVATSRAAETTDDIINVSSASVSEYGKLKVKLGKSNTTSLNLTGGKINTVALRVPVAAKHLFTGETSANVYSEYTRLSEVYFTPELGFVPGANVNSSVTHPVDSATVYAYGADQGINKFIIYDQTYDLYDLVEACRVFTTSNHEPLTVENLRKYGMDIVFNVATKAYTAGVADGTNQQEFAKLSGENNSILTPVTNDASGNKPGNQAIIGKQPVIRATLFDKVNNKIVDVKYVKVKFVAEDMTPVTITMPEVDLTGNVCSGASAAFTWDMVARDILTQLNSGAGMSKSDFTTIYGNNFTIAPANDTNGTMTVNVNATETSASFAVFNWSVTKEQLGNLKEGTNSKSFEKTVTFTNAAGLYPDVVVKFKFNVTTTVNALKLGSTDPIKWANNTMKVYVVPMQVPYVSGTSPKAYYDTNILEGRLKPYVTGLSSCENYDIALQSGSVGNLTLQSGYNHWGITNANQANLNEAMYSIPNNTQGKNLASNGGTIKVNWYGDVNGLTNNRYSTPFATVNLQVLKILNLNPNAAKAIVDNSAVQTSTVDVTITDAYGNLVAQTATATAPLAADYWDFYGCQAPTFNGEIKIADDTNGKNLRTLASLNMTANVSTDGTLTFQNNGAPLQADAYLVVPVQLTHLWGELTGSIYVQLKKNPNL